MRIAFLLIFAANILLDLVSYAVLPARVAIHFGLGGTPNGWGPGYVFAILMVAMHAFVFCMIYFSPRVIFAFPARWVNLPHKEYWLSEENRPRAEAKISSHMWQFGTAIFAFLLVAGALVLEANLSDPVALREVPFLVALAIFLVFTAWWVVSFVRAFRIPAGEAPRGPQARG